MNLADAYIGQQQDRFTKRKKKKNYKRDVSWPLLRLQKSQKEMINASCVFWLKRKPQKKNEEAKSISQTDTIFVKVNSSFTF